MFMSFCCLDRTGIFIWKWISQYVLLMCGVVDEDLFSDEMSWLDVLQNELLYNRAQGLEMP